MMKLLFKSAAVLLVIAIACSARAFALPRADSTPAQYGQPYAGVPDRQDVVIYQVNMRAFSAGGDFKGVTSRLDSIKHLGINVIYLMPIYPVGEQGSVNSPYCVRDYKLINKEFGDINDLRALVEGAHERQMAVMLDWVGNHTSWDHPWISMHPDWYKHDSTGKIANPGYGWTDVAQLDFTNPAMRLGMIGDMKYWVYAVNIDGFRCDYADGPPVDFWAQAIDTLRAIKTHKLLFLAEATRKEDFDAGFDYNFGFRFFGNLEKIFKENRSVRSIDSVNIKERDDATNGQAVVRYTTNHDVNGSDGTPIELFGGKRGSMAAFAIVATMQGIPMIYNGQEQGMDKRIVFPFTREKVKWQGDGTMEEEYRKIIGIHNASHAIKYGALQSYSTDDICAYTKESGAEEVLVLANLRNKKIDYKIPSLLRHTKWRNMMSGSKQKLRKKYKLKPYQYLILGK